MVSILITLSTIILLVCFTRSAVGHFQLSKFAGCYSAVDLYVCLCPLNLPSCA